MVAKIENPENFVRLNSRITKKQDDYIKTQKAKTGKTEGQVVRELLDRGMKK